MKKHWIAERNGNYLSSPRMKIQLSGYAIRYNPTPEPPRDELTAEVLAAAETEIRAATGLEIVLTAVKQEQGE